MAPKVERRKQKRKRKRCNKLKGEGDEQLHALEEAKKSIYLLSLDAVDKVYVWSEADPHAAATKVLVKDTIGCKQNNYSPDVDKLVDFSMAVFDSRIYIMGGYAFPGERKASFGGTPAKSIFAFDTTSDEWITLRKEDGEIASMLEPRIRPFLVCSDSKIYIFGHGLSRDAFRHPARWKYLVPPCRWIEVFDPRDGSSIAMGTSPPEELMYRGNTLVHAFDARSKQAVFCSDDLDYIYCCSLQTGAWSTMLAPSLVAQVYIPPSVFWGTSFVILGHLLVWHYYGTIYYHNIIQDPQSKTAQIAYRFPNAEELFGFPCQENIGCPLSESFLVNVGGMKLCLVAEDQDDFTFYMFRIRPESDSDSLTLDHLPEAKTCCPTPCSSLLTVSVSHSHT